MPGNGLRMAGIIPVSPVRAGRRPRVPAMPTAHTDWIDIAYAEHGDPAGQPVLLLHGFPDSRDTWDGVVHELRSDRLRLIVPDLRGYGDTRILQADAGGGTEAALGQDAVDLIDALQLGKAVVVGHDWGARAAYAAAALYPDRVRRSSRWPRPYVLYEGRQPPPPPQVQAYWYQWYFNTDTGAKGFKHDVVGFCRHLWRAWSPAWRVHRRRVRAGEPGVAPAGVRRPGPARLPRPVRQRPDGRRGTPASTRRSRSGRRSPSRAGRRRPGRRLHPARRRPRPGEVVPAGYHRHEVPDVGHFVQREAPRVVAELIRQAAGAVTAGHRGCRNRSAAHAASVSASGGSGGRV